MKVTAEIDRWKSDEKPDYPWTIDSPNWCGHKKGDIYEIREGAVTYCCKDMEEAWGKYVDYGNGWDSMVKSTDEASVNIFMTTADCAGVYQHPLEIDYCPWCKEGIRVELEEGKNIGK